MESSSKKALLKSNHFDDFFFDEEAWRIVRTKWQHHPLLDVMQAFDATQIWENTSVK